MHTSEKTQTVLITGASSGIGYELAKVFARNKYNLVLIARNKERLEKISAELNHTYTITSTVLPVDLSKPGSAESIVKELNRKSIAVDILVNNAGIGIYGRFTETEIEKELEIINVNIIALTVLTKLLLPQIMKSGHGKILNVASTSAFVPGPYLSIYHASKAYVLSFSEALAEELRDSGIQLTILCPGATKTEWHKRAQMKNMAIVNARAIDADRVAEAGFKALMQGKRIIITGIINRIAIFLFRFIPRGFLTRMGILMIGEKKS